MRINLHVIVIGAGLTGSFFLKEMIAYLHMKQENLIRTDITVFDPGSIGKEDLGAVYIREDLGQNRALLLSELLKEQYDYDGCSGRFFCRQSGITDFQTGLCFYG